MSTIRSRIRLNASMIPSTGLGPYPRSARIATLLVVAITLLGGCASAPSLSPSSVGVSTLSTVPDGNLLLSMCVTGATRADVRDHLVAEGKTPEQVEVLLGSFDGLVATGRCG